MIDAGRNQKGGANRKTPEEQAAVGTPGAGPKKQPRGKKKKAQAAAKNPAAKKPAAKEIAASWTPG